MQIKQKLVKEYADIVIIDKSKWTNPHKATVLHHTAEPLQNKPIKKPYHYSFYIDADGSIYQNHAIGGNNWGQYGNLVGHTGNYDYISIGIAGYYHPPHNDKLTPQVRRSIIQVQKWINKAVGRNLKLIPHRDVDRTACPGDLIVLKLEAGEFFVANSYTEPTEEEIKKALIGEANKKISEVTKIITKITKL